MTLPKGKLMLSDLERLVFPHLPRVDDPRPVLLDYGSARIDGNVVIASDPVLGIPLQFYGFFAVHYSATDVAMAWANPQYLSLGIYYPPDTEEEWLSTTMIQLGQEANQLNLKIIGGHTGGYDGLTIPVFTSTCIGILPDEAPQIQKVSPGHVVIAVGPIARETLWFLANVEPSTVDAILSRPRREEIAGDLDPFSVVPLIKHLPRERIALLHDIAEGGLATALFELKQATKLGITIQASEIPWDESSLHLFNYLRWNPLYCSSFGNFLIVTESEAANEIIQTIKGFNRKAAVIGAFTKKKHVIIETDEKSERLKPGEDPYTRYTDQIT